MIEHQIGAYTDCAHGMGLAAVSLPYYRMIYSFGLDKFVRFATEIWGISPDGKSKDEIGLDALEALEAFTKECGIVTSIKQLGATEEMLPDITNSTIIFGNGYKQLTADDIFKIQEECY